MQEQLEKIESSSSVQQKNKVMEADASQSQFLSDQVPNFMQKFMQDSRQLIEENGKEYFVGNDSAKKQENYQNRFDEIVFQSDNNKPDVLHRKTYNSCIGKLNQLVARSIWMFLLSHINKTDDDTKAAFNLGSQAKKLNDMIHDSNMSAAHQNLWFGNPAPEITTQT